MVEFWNFGIMELSNFAILVLGHFGRDLGILEHWAYDFGILEFLNFGIPEFWTFRILEFSNFGKKCDSLMPRPVRLFTKPNLCVSHDPMHRCSEDCEISKIQGPPRPVFLHICRASVETQPVRRSRCNLRIIEGFYYSEISIESEIILWYRDLSPCVYVHTVARK